MIRKTLFPLMAGALLLAACSEGGTAPAAAGGHRPSFGAARDTSTGASHYTSNGRNASVTWSGGGYDSTGGFSFDYGNVQAQDVGDVRNPAVLVSYQVQHCGMYGCQFAGGDGLVPSGALSGNDSRLVLDFVPSATPDFWFYGGAGTRIAVTWRPDGFYSTSSTGESVTRYPGYTFRANGVMSSSSASATGIVDGLTIPAGASGSMGQNHNVTLLFQK